MSQEKRIFSCSCDIKTIALFNIFVKTSPNFREIAAFAWHFFVNDAQLTFLEDTGGVENGKSEVLENKREHKKPPRQTPGRWMKSKGKLPLLKGKVARRAGGVLVWPMAKPCRRQNIGLLEDWDRYSAFGGGFSDEKP